MTRHRWLRAAIPFAALIAFWTVTLVTHWVQTPTLGDPGTLSPIGTGDDGSSRLAASLRDRGVRVDRAGSSAEAVRLLTSTPATVFMPTPDFAHRSTIRRIVESGNARRIVIVDPGLRTSMSSPAPIFSARTRWTAVVEEPGCSLPYAATAGPAAARRASYVADASATSCYGGGLVSLPFNGVEFVYIGATDPFRNSRFDEAGNAALATGLLDAAAPVIWLDLHTTEPTDAADLPDLPDLNVPEYRRGDRNRTDTGFSVIDAFPPTLWAGLGLAFAAALLLAVAQARRLGPPVAEPLPVLVPASETDIGRGRLYHLINARVATATTLRGAAVTEIARRIHPYGRISAALMPSATEFAEPRSRRSHVETPSVRTLTVDELTQRAAFVEQIARRTGVPDTQIQEILYGEPGSDDEALAAVVARVDALVEAVRRGGRPPRGGTP